MTARRALFRNLAQRTRAELLAMTKADFPRRHDRARIRQRIFDIDIVCNCIACQQYRIAQNPPLPWYERAALWMAKKGIAL